MSLPLRVVHLRWAAYVLLVGLLAPSSFSLAKRAAATDERLSVIDSIVKDAIHSGQVPGAVVLIGHDGQVVYR